MFKPLAVLVGLAALGIGSTAISAQSSFRNPGRGEAVERGGRANPRENLRRTRVWVEDFEMVEERYQEAGYYTTVERQIWVEETHVIVSERVLVPEAHVTTIERVLVPAGHYMVEEQFF